MATRCTTHRATTSSSLTTPCATGRPNSSAANTQLTGASEWGERVLIGAQLTKPELLITRTPCSCIFTRQHRNSPLAVATGGRVSASTFPQSPTTLTRKSSPSGTGSRWLSRTMFCISLRRVRYCGVDGTFKSFAESMQRALARESIVTDDGVSPSCLPQDTRRSTRVTRIHCSLPSAFLLELSLPSTGKYSRWASRVC